MVRKNSLINVCVNKAAILICLLKCTSADDSAGSSSLGCTGLEMSLYGMQPGGVYLGYKSHSHTVWSPETKAW